MKRTWLNDLAARPGVFRWLPLLFLFIAGDLRDGYPMASAAQALIASLDEQQRKQIVLPFGDSERTDWSYLPGRREGLSLGEMNDTQRSAAFDLLHTALSQQGYEKTTGVIELEGVLRELEGDYRNPDLYWFTMFGSPSDDSPWGWRLEGHHLSLNFSTVTSAIVATTPAFLGANPAIIPHGPKKGLRVLAAEEDEARKLVASLNVDQKRKAIISPHAPRDIITGTDRKARLSRFEGIRYADLDTPQQRQLLTLLQVYVDNMEHTTAGRQWERIRKAGLEEIHFAWAGTIVGGNPHYYRIHGPTFLVEYDNTQNNANHIHSVWRDFERDFGEDLLKMHYEKKEHPR